MLLQQLFVLRFAVGDGRATQQIRQIAARVLHLVDLLMRPFASGVGVRRQVIERASDAATVFRLIIVKINSDPLACLGQRHRRYQVERRLWLPLTIAPLTPSAYHSHRRFARQIWNGFKRLFASFGSGVEHLGGEISSSHSRAKSPLLPPAVR